MRPINGAVFEQRRFFCVFFKTATRGVKSPFCTPL